MNLRDKSILIYDFGLFSSLAERLARDFGKVGYHVPWETSFSDGREYVLGMGLKGVERVHHWDDAVDDYDCLCFPDVLCGDLQEYYRRNGYRVWGAGAGGELELLRWKTKQRLRRLELPVNECVKVLGTEALRAYLREHDDQFVKVSTFRGLGETWQAKNYELACGYIDDFEAKYGALKLITEFIVEGEIPDCEEIGYDGYCINGAFPSTAVWGIEKKDEAYFSKVVKWRDLPEGVLRINEALAPVLHAFQYRQFLSTEIREKSGEPYLIDITARMASPGGEVYCELFANLGEIIWQGSGGVLVEPRMAGDYGAQIILTSEWAEDHWMPVQFPEEIRQWIKLYNHCRIEGVDYTVPQLARMKQIGSVVAIGDDPEEVCKACVERAEAVEGFDLEREIDSLEKAREEVEALSAPA
jgi:hypothetical protein